MCTLLNGLEGANNTIGLESMCVGGGQGMAMIVERLYRQQDPPLSVVARLFPAAAGTAKLDCWNRGQQVPQSLVGQPRDVGGLRSRSQTLAQCAAGPVAATTAVASSDRCAVHVTHTCFLSDFRTASYPIIRIRPIRFPDCFLLMISRPCGDCIAIYSRF